MGNKRILSEWEKLADAVRGKHSKRLNSLLETMDDDEFMVHFPKVMEYAVPKLQRTEILEEAKEQVIKVIHVSDLEE
tara:strand:- start:1359 stop:1589 length:231 start_codon:yes stop_codon:yes gene_type:complete